MEYAEETLSPEEENTLKCALAFVVLKQRLKARLENEPPQSQKQRGSLHEGSPSGPASHSISTESTNDGHHITDGPKDSIGGQGLVFPGEPYLSAANTCSNTIESSSGAKGQVYLPKHNITHGSVLDQSPLNAKKNHIASMTNVALSMAISLYTKQIDMILNKSHGNNSESSRNVDNLSTQSSDTSSDDDSTTMDSPLLIDNKHDDELPKSQDPKLTDIPKSTTRKESTPEAKQEARKQDVSSGITPFVYDFQAASLHQPSLVKVNGSRSQSSSTFATLDGIVYHLASSIRSFSKLKENQTKDDKPTKVRERDNLDMQHFGQIDLVSGEECGTEESNDMIYIILWKYYFQPMIETCQLESKPNSSSINSDGQNNIATPSSPSQQRAIEIILGMCTILHRMVVFDNHILGRYVTIGLCRMLRCLSLSPYHSSQNTMSGSDINMKSSEIALWVQIPNILAVNCLHLLEEVVMLRFSIVRRTYGSQPLRYGTLTSNRYGDKENRLGKEVNDVISIMNRYIGKELQIPIIPDLMASFYIGNKKAMADYFENEIIQGSQAQGMETDEGAQNSIHSLRGLNTGSIMMVKLCIFDLMKKICSFQS